ncbi:MAG: IS5 family transposase [Gammaproteobacteria bacterium]|nr:IS5 family transposase [Gammaproteobacteria bacterium]
MAWKNLKQRSLADALLIEHDALKELDAVHDLIDWSRIEAHLSEIHARRKGEKAWPPLIMFKALLLQSGYGLSDPGLEKQLARDLLFRRFVALDISESVPDHSTFWRFRQTLERLSLLEVLLSEINHQLAEQGLYIKSGEVSIVDASVIEANRCRPNKRKEGGTTQDPEADWNVKAGSDGKRKSTYGYKAHINVDEEGFIKAVDYSSGSLHDSNCFTDLLSGVFGVLKLHYGMAKARYLGLSRNRTRFELMCVAHNIKRGLSVRQSSCV